MQTASNSQTLTIQLSPEDSERRGVDADSLAETLLHDSLTDRHLVSVADLESLEKLYTWRGKTEL